MFEGTVLDKCQLGDIVRQSPKKLDSTGNVLFHAKIHTVVDSDLILVFSEGRIVEYDTPSKLLKNENSEFSKLVKEYSRRSHHFSRRGNNQMGEMSTA
nr:unnamed protein product [Digitaria exilis]